MKANLSLCALAVGLSFAAAYPAYADPSHDQAAENAAEQARKAADDHNSRDNSLTYTPILEFSGVNKLKSAGLHYSFGLLPTGGIGFSTLGVDRFGEGVKASYDAATGNITYKTPDGLRVTFTAADEVPGQSNPQQRLFNQANPAGGIFGGSLSTPSINAVPLSYTRFGTLYASGTAAPLDGHAFVMGVPTLVRDLPRSGTAAYTAAVGGSAFVANSPIPLQLTGSTATFTADFASGTIATGLRLIGTPAPGGAPIALDTVAGVGSIAADSPGFTGLFTGTGSVTGQFSGAFFGPKAAEFGYDFLVSGTSGAGRKFSAIGGAWGINTPPPPPPPIYPTFLELTGVQNFVSAGLGYTVIPVPSGGVGFSLKSINPLGTSVAVQYDTATGDIGFTAPNGTATTFTAANEVVGVSTPQSRLFNKPNPAGGVYVGSLSGVALTYTRVATFYTAGTPAGLDGHTFVFGVLTLPSDLPTTGTATYTGGAGGGALLASGGGSRPLAGSIASLTADFATGSIATTLSLIMTPVGGVPTPLDVLTGTGSLGAVKPGFTGTLTGTGTVAGNFTGAFFGPQATEFAYEYLVGGINAAGTGFTAIGAAAGSRP